MSLPELIYLETDILVNDLAKPPNDVHPDQHGLQVLYCI